jgi:hypothetical protein
MITGLRVDSYGRSPVTGQDGPDVGHVFVLRSRWYRVLRDVRVFDSALLYVRVLEEHTLHGRCLFPARPNSDGNSPSPQHV